MFCYIFKQKTSNNQYQLKDFQNLNYNSTIMVAITKYVALLTIFFIIGLSINNLDATPIQDAGLAKRDSLQNFINFNFKLIN